MSRVAGRHVVLGVSGGIACYKSCVVARRLTEAGAVPVCLGIWGPADGGAEADGRAEGGAELAAYDAAIAGACHSRGGAFVALSPVYETPGSRGPAGRRTPWGISDATHPNDLGHRMIADLVLAACGRL